MLYWSFALVSTQASGSARVRPHRTALSALWIAARGRAASQLLTMHRLRRGEVAQSAGPGADVSGCGSPQLKRGQAGHNEKCSAPERCQKDSSLRFIYIKLSLYSRLLLVRRTDQQDRFVWAAPDAPSPGPPGAGRPITGVRLNGSQANAHAGGEPNLWPGRATRRPRREARASPPTRAAPCGRSAPRA